MDSRMITSTSRKAAAANMPAPVPAFTAAFLSSVFASSISLRTRLDRSLLAFATSWPTVGPSPFCPIDIALLPQVRAPTLPPLLPNPVYPGSVGVPAVAPGEQNRGDQCRQHGRDQYGGLR